MKKGIWFLIVLLYPFVAFAQKDSIYFDEVEIRAKSLKSSTNPNNQHWSTDQISAKTSNNLASFLNANSAVFIKNYGPNTLATSSLSGGNSSQTTIYWNDLPINNPMLGLLDLSLISVNAMEKISVSSTGNSSLWGNGNIGGGIFLTNQFTKKQLQIKSSYNSINQFSNYFATDNQFKKLQSSTKVEYITGENNYTYRLINGDKNTLENADVNQWQFMQSFYYPLNNNLQLMAHAWVTKAVRGIPPTTRQEISQDSTKDFNQRYSIQLQKACNDNLLKTTLAYFIDDNRFVSSSLNTINKVRTLSFNSTFDGQINKNIKYLIGLNNRHLNAKTSAYQKRIFQNQLALFSSVQFSNDKLQVKFNIREELIDQYLAPIAPSIYLSYRIIPSGSLSFDVARNYRYPSLNDLYWKPGGNENLKAENGWSYNVKFNYKTSFNTWVVKSKVTLYSRIVDDWIMWAKDPDTPFFSAFNIAKVWSRGILLNSSLSYQVDTKIFKLNASYNHTISTSLRDISLPKISFGDQLWYTPISQFNCSMIFESDFLSCMYRYNYTGESVGLQEKMGSYSIHDVALSSNHIFGQSAIEIILELNNFLNKSYRVIEYRPMPDRNLTIGLHYTIY